MSGDHKERGGGAESDWTAPRSKAPASRGSLSSPDCAGYPPDSAGWRSDTRFTVDDAGSSQPGSESGLDDAGGSQLGSDGYPLSDDDRGSRSDSDGSRGSDEPPSSSKVLQDSGEVADSEERSAPDFFRSLARAEELRRGDERRRAPGTWMPGPDDLDREPEPGDETHFDTDSYARSRGSRQLGLRLRPRHHELLLEAAALYGVRPTTMARMMVVRGVKAIHEAEVRRRARELRDEDA